MLTIGTNHKVQLKQMGMSFVLQDFGDKSKDKLTNFMTIYPFWLLRYFTKNHKCQPHGGIRENVRGSSKSGGFWATWISVLTFVAIQYMVVEIFQWLTDWMPTLPTMSHTSSLDSKLTFEGLPWKSVDEASNLLCAISSTDPVRPLEDH